MFSMGRARNGSEGEWGRERERKRRKAKKENDAYVESDKHICPDTLQSEYSWYDVAQHHALQVKRGSFAETPDHQLQWTHGEMREKREEKRKAKQRWRKWEENKNNVNKPIFILRFVWNLVFYTQSTRSSFLLISSDTHPHEHVPHFGFLLRISTKCQEEWEQERKRIKSLIFYFGPVLHRNRINTYVELLPLPHT